MKKYIFNERTPPPAEHRKKHREAPHLNYVSPVVVQPANTDRGTRLAGTQMESALDESDDDSGSDHSWRSPGSDRASSTTSSEDEEPVTAAGQDQDTVNDNVVSNSGSSSGQLPHTEINREARVYYVPCPSRKKYDTVNSCKYCGKIIKQKMKRHMVAVHKKEPEVKTALRMNKNESRQMFSKLINEGNFKRNVSVLKNGDGELILCRRPKRAGIPAERFRPCPGCFGFMLVEDLEKHGQRCVWLEETQTRNMKVRSDVLMGQFDDKEMPEVLTGMKVDTRKKVLQDPTLVAYASYTSGCKGRSKNQEKVLRDRLSKLVSLLEGVKSHTKKEQLTIEDICDPAMFDAVVDVTHLLGGYDEGSADKKPSFAVPSTPRVVGQALGKVVHVLMGQAIRDGDK